MARTAQKTKSDFLGEPFGTAANRLRRNLLFALAQFCGRTTCHRCALPIKSPETMSLDHKVDWLHVDKALFWDLNNIAFSHLKCNVSSRRPRKSCPAGPTGTLWCKHCKSFKPEGMFSPLLKNTSHRKRRYKCNECRKQAGWV